MNAGRTYPSLLLQPATGYPDTYVSTRLAPRLRELFNNHVSEKPNRQAEAWGQRHQAVLWSYWQLSARRRRQLEPIYLYTELPLLITAIRFKTAGNTEHASKLLSNSLWNHSIRRIVTTLNPEDTTYTELRNLLTHTDLSKAIDDANLHPLNRLEKHLFECLFLAFRRQRPPHLVRDYCAALVDLYNLARIDRYNDMDIRFIPLAGGKLTARDFNSPVRLLRGVTHKYGYTGSDISSPAQLLRFTMAKTLKKRALSGGCLDRICAYLWANMAYPEHLLQASVIPEGAV